MNQNEMKNSAELKQKDSEFQITKKYQYSLDVESKASIVSKIFFFWTFDLIRKGSRKHLELNDLFDVTDNQEPGYSHSVFSQIFQRIKESPSRLLTSMKNFIGDKFLLAGLLSAIAHSLLLIGPVMIKNILLFIEEGDQPISQGLFYVTVLIVSYILKAILLQHAMHMVNNNCIKVVNAANSLIYHKILGLSASSMKYLQTGSILNFVNVDIGSCLQFVTLSPYLFIGPLMISIAIILLVMEVGWLGFFVPVLFLLGTYWQQKLLNKGFEVRKKQLQLLDKRSKCINEYFSGIRIIKYYGWENFVWENIEKIRKQEVILSFSFLIIRTYIQMLIKLLPILASILIFGLYTSFEGGQTFTLAKGFSILSIFNLINNPMRLLVSVSIHYLNTKASIDRLQHFCQYDEKKQTFDQNTNSNIKTGEIIFNNCKYTWEDQKVKFHASRQGQTKKKNKIPKRNKLASLFERTSSEDQRPQIGLRRQLLIEEEKDDFQIQLRQLNNQKVHSLQIKSLKIQQGQFIAVVGRVASGKTTFLHAILSEIKRNSGEFQIKGSISYVSQVSWMRSTTIRQNILFESPYVEQHYKNIIKLCELQSDLQVLKGGDMTQIGEKGLNLSGGQKQRISLARALYQDADVYLIDDCLSALDSYVGKNIFKNVLRKYLKNKGKTIVLVTNALNYTDFCQRVLVMHKGSIVEDGNPKQLAQNPHSFYYNLKQTYKKLLQDQQNEKRKLRESLQKRRTTSIDLSEVSYQDEQTKKKKITKDKQLQGLVKMEQRIKGSIPWYFYLRFFTETRIITSISLFLFVLLCQLTRIGNDWWIGQWTQSKSTDQQSYYLVFYVIISFVVGLLMFFRGLFFAKFIIRTTKIIHRKLINSLLKTPLSWFDVTPTGRILARTIKDQYELDNTLPYNLQGSIQNLLVVASAIILISMATPHYIIIAIISVIGYMKLMNMYLNSSREIKRLESNCRAPLMSHIQETINGIYVIRAFKKTDIFINKFFEKQKAHIVTISNQNSAERWIHLCTQGFSILTIACAGYFGILNSYLSSSQQNLTMIGLALLWTIQMSSIMSYTVKILADTQNNMNSLVRMYDYIDNNPSQFSFEAPRPLSPNWPDLGEYSIENVSYKYRPQLNLVIKNISFNIEPMSKVGIVGRTGSGKSSITLGLLRILQITQNQDGTKGSIVLDEENISNLGLHYLRHNITMIPQDPTLFTGTIKSNIDPFDNYSDHEIAYSLRRVKLWEQIPNNLEYKDQIDQKLYSKVQEAGSNYSLGQKQLICMARALIRKPKVLIMDEATASVDEKTDEDIQNMIREEFTETTVVAIAHRLNTLIYYDKILVLDKGEVMEYDTPLNLVKNPNSFLGMLIRKTGYTYMKNIIDLAEKSAAAKQLRQKLLN